MTPFPRPEEMAREEIEEIPDPRVILAAVIDAIRDLRATLPERLLAILDRYLFRRERPTLEEMGNEFGVSRERVRQLKWRIAWEVERRVGPGVDSIATELCWKAGPVVREEDLRAVVDGLFGEHRADDPAVQITRRIVETEMGYDSVNGVCADPEASGALTEFRKRAVELADDVGLVAEEVLREVLAGWNCEDLVDVLAERWQLVRVSGHFALRATKKARVKAALLFFGRKATREEIAAESGVGRERLASLLAGIDGVARASKNKWGMKAWVDEEYEGIAAKIVQRIEENGGVTTLDRLVGELPRKFEVKASSVLAIAKTAQFVVEGGTVRLARDSEVSLRDIHEVVDGVTPEGWPYWRFPVRPEHFRGYSIAGVPPEVADALGCPKNGRIWAEVARPAGCRKVSVYWPLVSVRGASVGYISGALERLGVGEGDQVFLVVAGPGLVEFRGSE